VVPGEALAPQLFDVLCHRFPSTTRGTMRTRRAIVQASQTFHLITVGPFGSGAGANMKRTGGSLQGHHHNQLLWFCSNGQPLEMSQLASFIIAA
jgi:hypothetical protein